MLSYRSINPATEEVIFEKTETPYDEVIKTIDHTYKAFQEWRRTNISERAKLIGRLGQILLDQKNQFGELMAKEMGKPINQGIAEAEKCAWLCRYYAENGEKLLQDEIIPTDASKSYVSYQPIGIVLGIMPWNFPLWQVYRFIVPAMMAGNGTILKHAPNVSLCAEAIESTVREAGFPEHLFDVIFVQPEMISKIIEHPYIQGVTLTGSTRAGQAVAAKAGEQLKKTVMELGGSDPYIILHDADLKQAAEACVTSRLINTGQSCIAAKRFIVVRSVLKAFEDRVVDLMRSKKTGNPLDPENDLGPLARKDLRDTLHNQVIRSINQGAKLLLGGELQIDKGFFYPPTVLTNVKKGMAVYDEETFGPVAAIIPVQDEQEAIQIANDTIYGLGGAVFSRDIHRAEKIAREDIFAGNCFVNTFVKSDPRLPFGGTKLSGYGRELSMFGLKEFTNIKTIFIK
jgi:succinate-semialdehyde dehydrogenase/glutarate-semialdehyde dehydrogenase